jgi:hypothetical protein
MASEPKVLTAARAIIKVNGHAIGRIQNFRATENISRASVMGIGSITRKEVPPLSIVGTWSARFYTIDFGKITGFPGMDNRDVASVEQYKNTMILAEIPIDIVIYKKDNPTVTGGVVTATDDVVFCTIRDCFINSRGFDLSEGQVSGTDLSGEYLNPIINS